MIDIFPLIIWLFLLLIIWLYRQFNAWNGKIRYNFFVLLWRTTFFTKLFTFSFVTFWWRFLVLKRSFKDMCLIWVGFFSERVLTESFFSFSSHNFIVRLNDWTWTDVNRVRFVRHKRLLKIWIAQIIWIIFYLLLRAVLRSLKGLLCWLILWI